jgi:hypothetical protein
MANEFQHKDPGTSLTQAEYITTDGTGHIFDCQATGDILYASSATVLSKLVKQADNTILTLASCIPAWTATPTLTTLTTTGGIELGHASDTTIARSGSGAITVEGNQVYLAGGTDVALADGGTGASLSDPGADRIMFWDDGASAVAFLTAGSGLTICGTTITAAGLSGLGCTDNVILRANGTGGATAQGSTATINDCGDLAIAATGKVYLDGGGNTYITETNADTVDYYVGGSQFLRMDRCSSVNYELHYGLAQFQDGTAGSPGITFVSDSNTGIYRVGSDCIGTSAVDLKNNTLSNIGAAGNDWTANCFTHSGSGATQSMAIETSDTGNAAVLRMIGPASHVGGIIIQFTQGDGGGSANNQRYTMGYCGNPGRFKLAGSDQGADIIRVCDDSFSINANTTWVDCNFDAHDDAMVLWRAFSPEGQQDLYAYSLGKAALQTTKSELADIGVLKRYYKICGAICEDFLGYNDQRMAALLAGGIYQTRFTLDKNHECHEARLKALEARLNG